MTAEQTSQPKKRPREKSTEGDSNRLTKKARSAPGDEKIPQPAADTLLLNNSHRTAEDSRSASTSASPTLSASNLTPKDQQGSGLKSTNSADNHAAKTMHATASNQDIARHSNPEHDSTRKIIVRLDGERYEKTLATESKQHAARNDASILASMGNYIKNLADINRQLITDELNDSPTPNRKEELKQALHALYATLLQYRDNKNCPEATLRDIIIRQIEVDAKRHGFSLLTTDIYIQYFADQQRLSIINQLQASPTTQLKEQLQQNLKTLYEKLLGYRNKKDCQKTALRDTIIRQIEADAKNFNFLLIEECPATPPRITMEDQVEEKHAKAEATTSARKF